MALPIRQGATHKVVVGPAVDKDDGITNLDTLDISTADDAVAILHDNDTVVDIAAYTWGAITNALGYYHLTLQSGITNTVGHVTISIYDVSLCLPIRMEFVVLDTAAYDAIYKDAAIMDVNVNTIKSQTVTCGAGVTVRADVGAAAAPGAANGMFIGGTNAATTVASLSVTGQLDANSLLIDTTTTLTGNVSMGGAFDVAGALTAGSVSIDAGFDVVGALSANSLLIDTTTALTGAVTMPAGLTADITGTIDTVTTATTATNLTNAATNGDFTATMKTSLDTACDTATVTSIGNNVITAASIANEAIDAATFAADVDAEILSYIVDDATRIDASALNTHAAITPATSDNVNTEVSDVLKTDTISEMAQGIPPTTPTFEEAIMYIYMALTKSIDVDSGFKEFYNNAGSVVWKKALSDDNSNYVEAKGESGA